MKKPFDFLGTLFSAPWKALDEPRKRSVRIAAALAVFQAGLILVYAKKAAGMEVSADHPRWEAILQAKLLLERLILGLPLPVWGFLVGVTLYQVLENSELGKRLVVWSDKDTPEVKAQKTRNGGTLLAALVAACIVAAWLGSLR